MSYPSELIYTEDHEWIRIEGDVATVGITWHAQDSLGDIVFAQLPEIGGTVSAGEAISELESVKAVSDVFAPIGGEVVEVNEELDGAEESINQDPYGDGWLFKIKLADTSELEDLLDSAAYQQHLGDDDGAAS
jgi:glycine cleavage system H protein